MNYPNWFEMTARANFERFLPPHRSKTEQYTALQIGVYVGHATHWITQNCLRPGDLLIDVDTWRGSDEEPHKAMDWDDVLWAYKERNMPALKDGRVVMYRQTSNQFFFYHGALTYDFVYIDGDHTEDQVYRDACNAWRYVKVGGIMAFDDYTWGEGLPIELRPKRAIDRFLAETENYALLCRNSQVWITKV